MSARALGATVLVVAVGACTTTPASVSMRDLPVGLVPAGALLTGCTASDDDAVVRARCEGEVVLSMLTRPVGAAEPRYREEAFALGGSTGARLAWDQIEVPTEGPSGLVDRAQLLAPLATLPVATMIGAVRGLGGREVQELWCSSRDSAGDARCRQLLGALLGTLPKDVAGKHTTTGGGDPPPRRMSGPLTLFGRALSLPTSCTGALRPDGGDAHCDDGATLSWRKLPTMDQASEALVGTLAALDLGDGEPYGCTVASEPGQCQDHGRAAAGLCYLDGAPITVACFAVNAKAHPLCVSVLRAR
ncbi:MAG: hypothetical protein IT383_09400 [Deltaproteobacteria bacterium]|nr:hypothetical protein [Deltaproteobacteria bacterium]